MISLTLKQWKIEGDTTRKLEKIEGNTTVREKNTFLTNTQFSQPTPKTNTNTYFSPKVSMGFIIWGNIYSWPAEGIAAAAAQP